jgi:UDP-N-acetylmuramoylalanine--D-glutamate ligase
MARIQGHHSAVDYRDDSGGCWIEYDEGAVMNSGKKVAILGLGISGYESALFLKDKGYDLFVSDQGDSPAIHDRAEALRAKQIEVETRYHTLERILSVNWVLISPGIPPFSSVCQEIRKKNIPIYSEIEVASWFCASSNIVAVTGSSGKTTVTTLISRVLEKTYGKVYLCGNIGNPWIGELDKIRKNDYVVIEISSFQLMHCETFRPHIGVLLNLSPNHQDWHSDMEDYANAKLRLFQSQKAEDYALIRSVDQQCFFPHFSFQSRTIHFDDKKVDNPNEEVVRRVAQLLNCKESDVDEVLKNFEGIEHRLEKVATVQGVQYINDSKCTTTASLAWALEKMPDQSVVLLAGGHPKSNDFDTISNLIHRKVKFAVLIGEARSLLRKAWSGACPIWETDDFRSAIHKAKEVATSGDAVLLSPACASFDMFKNYIERGNLFKKIVKEEIAEETQLK